MLTFSNDVDGDIAYILLSKLLIDNDKHYDNVQDINDLITTLETDEALDCTKDLILTSLVTMEKRDAAYALMLYIYMKGRVATDARIKAGTKILYDYIQEHSPETLKVLDGYVSMFKNEETETRND